ncbi:MAG: hypothetical protein WCR27_07795 [Eubacteriales bacterium]
MILNVEVSNKEIRILAENHSWFERKNCCNGLNYYKIPLERGIFNNGILENEDRLVEVLNEFRKKILGKRKLYVNLLVPFEGGLLKNFNLPAIKPKDIYFAVYYFLEDELPVSISEWIFEYKIVDRTKEQNDIHVLAIKKVIVNQYVNCFNKAGYEISKVDFAVEAIGDFLGYFGYDDIIFLKETYSECLQIVNYYQSIPLSVRYIENEIDLSRYFSFNVFNDRNTVVESIITDGSSLAEVCSRKLINSGIGENKVFLEKEIISVKDVIAEKYKKLIVSEGSSVFAVLGEILNNTKIKSKNKEKIKNTNKAKKKNFSFNFYRERVLKCHKRILAVLTIVFLCCSIMFCIFWYPYYSQAVQTTAEIKELEEKISLLKDSDMSVAVEQWGSKINTRENKNLYIILKKIVDGFDDAIDVERINYQNGKITILVECLSNVKAANFVDELMVAGGKNVNLMSYKCNSLGEIQLNITLEI